MISQLTVFLANEKGRLAAACRTLADADINMKALFIADTADFGIVRIFCDTPKRAVEVLGQAGFRASLTPVIAVSVEDAPGTLADLLGFCQGASMNIEYGYCFCTADGKAVDVLRVSAFLHHAVKLVVNRRQCRVVGDQIHVRVGRQQPSSGQRRLRKVRKHGRRRIDQLRLEASIF